MPTGSAKSIIDDFFGFIYFFISKLKIIEITKDGEISKKKKKNVVNLFHRKLTEIYLIFSVHHNLMTMLTGTSEEIF